MSLERMFEVVEGLRETACADAAFGQPQEVEGRVLIPVASVSTGFGLGFGERMKADRADVSGQTDVSGRTDVRGTSAEDEEEENAPAEGEGGGAGGGAGSRPIAVIEVTPEGTVIKPILDEGKIALAGIALVAWIVFWVTATVRAVFGQES